MPNILNLNFFSVWLLCKINSDGAKYSFRFLKTCQMVNGNIRWFSPWWRWSSRSSTRWNDQSHSSKNVFSIFISIMVQSSCEV